ncbi:MAG: FimV/HubP family polar landmark protein, partial [Solimonas sp.]
SAAAPASAPAAAAITANPGELYGPVKPAETLWSIATRLRPGPDITMDQVLLAIYRGNPRAFDGGSINGLEKGAMLRVPSAADMRATSATDAKGEIARLRGLRGLRASPGAAVAAPHRPRLEPAEITPPPPASSGEAVPSAVSAQPDAAAAAEPAPAATPASSSSAGTGASAAPVSTEDAATPAPEAAPVPKKAVQSPSPPREEDGLLETLLIPLVLGLLLLFSVAYLFSRWRRRRNSAATPSPPPGPSRGQRRMPVSTPSAGQMAAAAAAMAAAPKLTAQEKREGLQETLDAGVSEGAVAAASQRPTQPDAAPPAEASASVPAVGLPPVDFDLSGPFAAQTVQIDLDANDPVSEADFHLAYGLYDEAALLLTQAAAKEPERTDIAVKLAETYFAAGKVAEFGQTVAGLEGRLTAAERQKLAIMGQQLDSASTRSAGGTGGTPPGIDLDPGLDTVSASAPTFAPPPAADRPPASPLPDFQLDDLELSSLDAAALGDPQTDRGAALDFDLGDFDRGHSASSPAAPAPAAAAGRGNTLDFDLSSFAAQAAPSPSPAAAASPAVNPVISTANEIRLGAFDFDAVPADSGEISGDEAGTKLDLARAYVDMGDNEMARGLLNEVRQQGNEAQQHEAQTLLSRLG